MVHKCQDLQKNTENNKTEKSAPGNDKKPAKEVSLKSKIDENDFKAKKSNCNCKKGVTIYTLPMTEEKTCGSKKRKRS